MNILIIDSNIYRIQNIKELLTNNLKRKDLIINEANYIKDGINIYKEIVKENNFIDFIILSMEMSETKNSNLKMNGGIDILKFLEKEKEKKIVIPEVFVIGNSNSFEELFKEFTQTPFILYDAYSDNWKKEVFNQMKIN